MTDWIFVFSFPVVELMRISVVEGFMARTLIFNLLFSWMDFKNNNISRGLNIKGLFSFPVVFFWFNHGYSKLFYLYVPRLTNFDNNGRIITAKGQIIWRDFDAESKSSPIIMKCCGSRYIETRERYGVKRHLKNFVVLFFKRNISVNIYLKLLAQLL